MPTCRCGLVSRQLQVQGLKLPIASVGYVSRIPSVQYSGIVPGNCQHAREEAHNAIALRFLPSFGEMSLFAAGVADGNEQKPLSRFLAFLVPNPVSEKRKSFVGDPVSADPFSH